MNPVVKEKTAMKHSFVDHKVTVSSTPLPPLKFSLLSALVLVLVSFMIVGGCGGGGRSSSDGIEDNNTHKPTQVVEPSDHNADEIARLRAEVAKWKAEAEKPCPTCPTKTCPSDTRLGNKIPDELPLYPTHSYGDCDGRPIDVEDLHGSYFRYWECKDNKFLGLYFYNPKKQDGDERTFSGYIQGSSADRYLSGDYTLNSCNLSVDFRKEGVDNWEAEILSLDARKMVLIDKDTNTRESCYQN